MEGHGRHRQTGLLPEPPDFHQVDEAAYVGLDGFQAAEVVQLGQQHLQGGFRLRFGLGPGAVRPDRGRGFRGDGGLPAQRIQIGLHRLGLAVRRPDQQVQGLGQKGQEGLGRVGGSLHPGPEGGLPQGAHLVGQGLKGLRGDRNRPAHGVVQAGVLLGKRAVLLPEGQGAPAEEDVPVPAEELSQHRVGELGLKGGHQIVVFLAERSGVHHKNPSLSYKITGEYSGFTILEIPRLVKKGRGFRPHFTPPNS